MISRRSAWLRAVVVVVAGAAMIGSEFLPAVLAVAAEEGDDPDYTGAALLWSPYVLLAVTGRRARTIAWLGILLVLLAGTALGLVSAGSSSTGAIIFVWLLPLQWGLAVLAAYFAPGAIKDPSPGSQALGPLPPEPRDAM